MLKQTKRLISNIAKMEKQIINFFTKVLLQAKSVSLCDMLGASEKANWGVLKVDALLRICFSKCAAILF